MARQRPAPARKRRTREHVIADLSINHVERQALLCGSSVERIQHDYGVDLFVLTYDRHGERENGEILFQVKATDRLRLRAGGQAVTCRVEASDLRSWLSEPMPVILVLYDARKEVGYWLYLQAHFEEQPGFDFRAIGQRVTVAVPRSNVLDRAAMRQFTRFKKAVLAQQRGLVHHEDQ
jgi:hypothetical protein